MTVKSFLRLFIKQTNQKNDKEMLRKVTLVAFADTSAPTES